MKQNRLFIMLLACGMLPLAPAASAQDVVKLTTGKPAGETVSLQLNKLTSGVTVDWGDGVAVPVPAAEGDWLTISGTVKGAGVITLTSESKISTLICPGMELTALDVTGAQNLRSLYCQDNQIATLDLSSCAKLTDLNCSRNKLTSIKVTETTHPLMENFSAEGNGLKNTTGSGNSFALRNTGLQHVDISNNAITSVTIGTANDNLDVLKCGGNSLSTLTLTAPDSLSVLMAAGNKLQRVTMNSNGMPALRQVFLDNNQIQTLDLSTGSALRYVSVADNELTHVDLPAKKKLYAYVCGNNKLTVSSLPSRNYKPDHISYMPQAEEVDITAKLAKASDGAYYAPLCPNYSSRTKSEYQVDLSDWALDADGASGNIDLTFYKKENGSFVEMAKASSSNKDGDYFPLTSKSAYGKVAFLKAYDEAYVEFSSDVYPDLVSRSTAFRIGEAASGIGSVTTAAGLEVIAGNGAVELSCGAGSRQVRIFSADGKLSWQGSVGTGKTIVRLPSGIYIVNGQKIAI